MSVTEVYEYGNKFDFSKIKVGDIVVITATEYSFNNNRETWPKRSYFQLNKVTKVGEDYVEIEGKYKYKQATGLVNYFPLLNGGTQKEIEYISEYLKITRCPDEIAPIDNKTYDTNYNKVYENQGGVCSPRYLFVYDEKWQKNIKICEQETIERKKAEEEKKIEEQRILEMKKDSKEQYDAIIDPLVKKLEALKEKIYNEKCKAFDKFYCDVCSHNGDICICEREFGYHYYNSINPKTHKDKDGYRYRPIDDCKYFEKKEK